MTVFLLSEISVIVHQEDLITCIVYMIPQASDTRGRILACAATLHTQIRNAFYLCHHTVFFYDL